MRLLLDANLSPRVATSLRSSGFEATHVVDVGLVTATDSEIFDRAVLEQFVVVTADSDFGMLLALRRTSSPSADHLAEGAIVSLSPTRLAVRNLPLP